VSSIENNFYYCLNLQTIAVDSRNRVYSSAEGVLFNKAQTALIVCPAGKSGNYVSPHSVTRIGDYAFSWCMDLTGVVIPEGVTNIGFASFFSCMGLSSITIPASVTSIDDWAFSQCSNLTAIYFRGNAPILGGLDLFFNDNLNRILALPAGHHRLGGVHGHDGRSGRALGAIVYPVRGSKPRMAH
jgi:hypothetical protein